MHSGLRLGVSILWLAPVAAMAAPILNVDGNGQLLGASGVDVGGVNYDVAFVEGDCFAVFDNCNEDAFTFTTQADALAASAALLAQVFTDFAVNGLADFDSQPSLTLGCTSTTLCGALTPYQIGFGVRYANAANSSDENLDELLTGATSFAFDREDTVWTVWTETATPVPGPSTISLLALGLAGMVCGRRRHRRIHGSH